MSHRLIAMLIAAMLVVGACGSKPASGHAHGVPDQLQFSATTLDGRQFSGETLLGKPAVLWFWAPWCPNCQREAPTVAKVAAANPTVTFVGVAARAEESAMREFVDKYHVDGFTQLADTKSAVWTKFGVTQQPAYAFVQPDGSIDVVKGTMTESQLSERVSALSKR
ncbi:thiol:disulfide interchange protein [Mycobacterium kyorinense]|uniref:Soluble secreted antigen MPT53 n=1 Tax=Mycobacterium kyorinense TaxID=487514 RepID=A0A1A2ZHM0_9MYCO|nr:protein disulfide oxidoreductase [Mycobacterium kyorinense]OBI49740.1 thiol:disulfide interchange protein [Mycobacterium kyorinense]